MKLNISEQLARIAITAAAAICGAVFSMSTASAQTPTFSDLSLDSENGRVTSQVTSTPGALFCCQAIQSADDSLTSPTRIDGETSQDQRDLPGKYFISGAGGNNVIINAANFATHRAVYDIAAAFDSGDFDFTKPFMALSYFYPNLSTFENTPALRVAGITGGDATVDKNKQLLSVNISDLEIGENAAFPQALTYQWKTAAGTDIANATLQTYTADSGATVQVLITDKAGEKTFTPILATADERTAEDCEASEVFVDSSKTCRPRVQADCTGTTLPVIDATSNECRATIAADCTETQTFDTDSCRPTIATDCTAETQVFATDRCRATIAADCTAETQVFATDRCRATIAADCTAETQVFATDRCRATIAGDCTATQVFATDRCRARVQADCTGTSLPIINEGVCRAREAEDCTAEQVFVDSSKTCRARVETDCTAGQVFVDSSKVCRARVETDCTAGQVFVDSSKVCRARVETDCTGNTPVFADGSCRARVQEDCTGETPILTNGVCEAATESGGGNNSGNTGGNTGGSTASDNNAILYAGGAVVGALFILSYFQSEAADKAALSFSPAYNYSFTESGYAYNAGGRVDYQRDNLRLFWTATQDNKDGEFGDFRYSSGAEYESDNWAASFSESVAGKVADYDFSFAAAIPGDDWKISSVYRLHSRFEEDDTTGWESDSKNSLSLEGVFALRGWELKPSAGFQWQNAEKFGETAKFGLDAAFNYKQWHITPAAAYQTNDNNTKLNLQITRRF